MATLLRAQEELFRRTPDEVFSSLDALHAHCHWQRDDARDLWERPEALTITHDLSIVIGNEPDFRLNDWSFSQFCRMAGVSKETINRLSHKTASRALEETLPRSEKPLQLLSTGSLIRSVHGVAYTRLWNADLLDTLRDVASGFDAPQPGITSGTGLYCGEQDMFAFLIDPLGWVEIDNEAFAPGFFVWNSEVGRRTVGIQTFWFQAVCQNHIVWDAVEVVEFTRKHTANVHEGLAAMQRIVAQLVAKRDDRRDSFARVLRKAMTERLGSDAEETVLQLIANGIPRDLAKRATEVAVTQGCLTIFSLVDALTRLSQSQAYIGDRTGQDTRIGQLLALAA